MGTFFAAVIRCPMTSVLMVLELTQNYSLILPLMAGNMIAFLLAGKLRIVPIYDALLLQDGISLKKMPTYQGERDWRNLPVATIMTHDVLTVEADRSIADNLAAFERKKHAYPVVEGTRHDLLGMVTHHDIARQQNAINETLDR